VGKDFDGRRTYVQIVHRVGYGSAGDGDRPVFVKSPTGNTKAPGMIGVGRAADCAGIGWYVRMGNRHDLSDVRIECEYGRAPSSGIGVVELDVRVRQIIAKDTTDLLAHTGNSETKTLGDRGESDDTPVSR